MKNLINLVGFDDFKNYLEVEEAYQNECSKTEDFKEGITAFSEKRKPNFQGK